MVGVWEITVTSTMVKYATTENVTAPSEWKPQVIYVSTKPSGFGMDGNSIRAKKKLQM